MSMFGDLNKVQLMGNVTADPDLRFTTSGSAVLNFSVATNRRYKQGEEWKDEVSYHNVVVWRSAEQLAKRIKKGTRVLIEGRIQNRSWEGNDGEKKYRTEVVADDVMLIARYEGGSDDASSAAAPKGDNAPKSDESIDPDDLPF